MFRQNLVALTVTTLLGVVLGGFVLWKGIQRRWSTSRETQQQQQQPHQQQQQPHQQQQQPQQQQQQPHQQQQQPQQQQQQPHQQQQQPQQQQQQPHQQQQQPQQQQQQQPYQQQQQQPHQQQHHQVPGRREWPPPEDALRAPRASWEERILQAEVVTVSQEVEWNQIQPFFRRELEDFPVLGIDCEWIIFVSSLKKLVNMSTKIKVLEKLVKTDLRDSQTQTEEFKGFPKDAFAPNQEEVILKLDAYIPKRSNILCNGLSLKSLAETILNFPLDKSLLLRCSNWDAENLTEDQ
ncbi:hypothetical protein STEG23_013134, partial [Scotinomys teguina]